MNCMGRVACIFWKAVFRTKDIPMGRSRYLSLRMHIFVPLRLKQTLRYIFLVVNHSLKSGLSFGILWPLNVIPSKEQNKIGSIVSFLPYQGTMGMFPYRKIS